MISTLPTKGMRDFLPNELETRQKTLEIILRSYKKCGFTQIETPCVENIQLLTSNQGGDNEKLIYKILKRGEKLNESLDGELCDLALRYDLTVPLSRYYSNNHANLPAVFKAIQIGNVWRADRPQKGRFRQFLQCDIDIINDQTNLAEFEIINATAYALSNLNIGGFTVRISDRRLLKAFASVCGAEDKYFDLCIILDKIDKIGLDGVEKQLAEILSQQQMANVSKLLREISFQDLDSVAKALQSKLEREVVDSLSQIVSMTQQVGLCKIQFDFSLVRGMGYYTGTIFEIAADKDPNGGSIAGGGRYDNLIGKFSGKNIAACGFSIGFERILNLIDQQNASSQKIDKVVFIFDGELNSEILVGQMKKANEYRLEEKIVWFERKRNNFGLQIKQLRENGATEIILVQSNGEIRTID